MATIHKPGGGGGENGFLETELRQAELAKRNAHVRGPGGVASVLHVEIEGLMIVLAHVPSSSSPFAKNSPVRKILTTM